MNERFATTAAIEALALRFVLPASPEMQDWAWEVADPSRLDEFLAVYDEGDLTPDERFVLMEMILQSFEDRDADPGTDPRWPRVLASLTAHLSVHAPSIRYWASLEEPSERWHVPPEMRRCAEVNGVQLEGRAGPLGRLTRR